MQAFYDLLSEATAGRLIPDRALSRPGQLVFLPNRGDFYRHGTADKPPLALNSDHPIIQRREQNRAAVAEGAREAAEAMAARKARRGEDDGIVGAFNAAHDIADLMLEYGYTPEEALGGVDWQSPYQTSGSYATRYCGDHWISLSASDASAGLGRATAAGHRYGDAFDLYAHFQYNGDFGAAIRAYAEETGRDLKTQRQNLRPEDFFEPVQDSLPSPFDAQREDQAKEAWDEPFDIFGDAKPAQLSSPPPGALPDVLERWSQSEARRKGVSPAFAAAAAVAVVAGAIGNGLTLQPRRKDTGWKVPSALWISLVDQPGSGKSPIIAAALAPLGELDAERRKIAAAQAAREQANRDAEQKAEPKGRKNGTAAKSVSAKRSLVDNATMEKLVSLLADNPRGLIQKPDELTQLFGALGAYKKSGDGDRGQLLRLYDGGSVTIDRVGSGTTHAENALLSILAGTQPNRIGRLVRDLGSDGMLQRFLFVLGDEIERGGGEDEAPDEDAAREYRDLIRYLATAVRSGKEPVVLSDEAHVVLAEAEAKIRSLKHCPGAPDAWAEHVAKWNGTLYRIALAFHAVECWRAWDFLGSPVPTFPDMPLSAATAHRAAGFSRFMLRHALTFYQRFFERGEMGEEVRKFAGFILTAPEKTVYSRRNAGQALRELRDRRQLYSVTRELEGLGWLRAVARDAEGASKWEINPAVHARFAERAKWEAEDRKQRQESIKRANEDRRDWLDAEKVD